ncbi:hypothetical protein ACS0TY_030190 [Phlomoides rotata]
MPVQRGPTAGRFSWAAHVINRPPCLLMLPMLSIVISRGIRRVVELVILGAQQCLSRLILVSIFS